QAFANMLVPLGAAALALTAALAGYVMVKFYGVIFLGQLREPKLADAHDCGRLERVGLLWLAVGCVALGLLPGFVLGLLDQVNVYLLNATLATHDTNVWLAAPVSAQRAAYGPIVFLVGSLAVVAVTYLAVRRVYH